MALSFQTGLTRKRSQIVAIDLGWHATKAVSVQRKGAEYELNQFAILPAPSYDKTLTAPVLGEHLKAVSDKLAGKIKTVVLVIGVNDSLLRLAEMPMVPLDDMRLMLKYNTKSYLQQDFPDHVFDCFILTPPAAGASGEIPKNAKCRVLVGGAKRAWLETLQQAAKEAGLIPEEVTLSPVGATNAFEKAEPEAFANEVVALVDIGFKNSNITILRQGQLSLSRVVGIGGDKLTTGLAEFMGLNYADAESQKLALAEEAQPYLMNLLIPLGRELRASIDFFEKQEEKTVSQVYLAGATARSTFIIESLQSELMVPCKRWNPVGFLNLALPAEQRSDVEQQAPLLAVAVGAALSSF